MYKDNRDLQHPEAQEELAAKKKPTVAFDVDDTLVAQTTDGKDVPRYEVIQLFRLLQKFGCKMYIWSGGGIDYAEHWRDKLGLVATVAEKFSFTPDIVVDDGYEIETNATIITVGKA